MYCPRVLKKLENTKTLSFSYNTTWSGGAQYQVLGNDEQFVIDKNNKTCSCRRWQLKGVLCCHAISAIYYNQDKPENYIDDYYKVSTFLEIYGHILYPTQGKDCWPKSDQCPMIPPYLINRKRGRRSTMRRRDATKEIGFTKGKVSRKGTQNKCSMCGATGHNKRFHGLQVGEFYSPCIHDFILHLFEFYSWFGQFVYMYTS